MVYFVLNRRIERRHNISSKTTLITAADKNAFKQENAKHHVIAIAGSADFVLEPGDMPVMIQGYVNRYLYSNATSESST